MLFKRRSWVGSSVDQGYAALHVLHVMIAVQMNDGHQRQADYKNIITAFFTTWSTWWLEHRLKQYNFLTRCFVLGLKSACQTRSPEIHCIHDIVYFARRQRRQLLTTGQISILHWSFPIDESDSECVLWMGWHALCLLCNRIQWKTLVITRPFRCTSFLGLVRRRRSNTFRE